VEAALKFLVEQDVGLESTDPRRDFHEGDFDALVEATGAIVLAVDSRQRVVWANPEWLFASGHHPETVGEVFLSDLFEPSEWERVSRQIPEVIQRGRRVDLDSRMLRHDGTYLDVFGRISPWLTGSGEAGAQLLLFDVTARNAEKARDDDAYKLERVGRLTAGIGHDFGNVFAVVKMNAEMLKLTLGAENADLFEVEQVLGATEDGMKIVHNLMAFGRGHSIRPISLDPVLLISLLEEPVRAMLASEMVLEIELEEGADAGVPIIIDTKALEEIFAELVENAVDAMAGQGVLKIEVGAPQVAPDYGVRYTRLTVRDDGPGMTPKELERIFDPFYSKKLVGKGTGLGLPMLRRTIQAHEGHLLVESDVGVGTAFHLFFPCGEAPDPSASFGPLL
jgi:PAS domain S-box-containing protein